MFRKAMPWAAAALLFPLAAPLAAHHSQAMFDLRQPRTITGTVRQFQFTNPHCYVQVVVRGPSGEDEEWSVEMGAPSHLLGRGWGRQTFKPGDRVTIVLSPLRDGSRGGELVSATTADGKPLGKGA